MRRDRIPLRTHERIVGELLAVIRDQNDRIMHLAGSSWTLPPPVVYPDAEDEVEPDWVTDAEQVEA